jgi:hypothetical protein
LGSAEAAEEAVKQLMGEGERGVEAMMESGLLTQEELEVWGCFAWVLCIAFP